MDGMAESHRRDYQQKARIDTLRTVIRDFLDEPPSRVAEGTVAELRSVLAGLERASARIVAAWD